MVSHLAKTFARYKGNLGPSGQKLEKSPKMSSRGLSAPGTNSRKPSRKRVKIMVEQQSLFGPGAEGPRDFIFGLFFQRWARRAQKVGSPVAGPRNPKSHLTNGLEVDHAKHIACSCSSPSRCHQLPKELLGRRTSSNSPSYVLGSSKGRVGAALSGSPKRPHKEKLSNADRASNSMHVGPRLRGQT